MDKRKGALIAAGILLVFIVWYIASQRTPRTSASRRDHADDGTDDGSDTTIDDSGTGLYPDDDDYDAYADDVHIAAQSHTGQPTGASTVTKPKPTRKGKRNLSLTVMSGRYDADLSGVQHDFDRERDAGRSIIVTTEQGGADRTHILESDPDYGVARIGHQGFKAENAVLYRKDEWELVKAYDKELIPGGGPNRYRFPVYATIAILRSKRVTRKGKFRMLAVVAVHMPAHIGKGSDMYSPIMPILWRRALSKLAAEVRSIRNTYPGIAVVLAGDWNASQRIKWAFLAMMRAFPQFAFGAGDMFGNAWTTGLRTLGHKSLPSQGSDHDVERLNYEW